MHATFIKTLIKTLKTNIHKESLVKNNLGSEIENLYELLVHPHEPVRVMDFYFCDISVLLPKNKILLLSFYHHFQLDPNDHKSQTYHC